MSRPAQGYIDLHALAHNLQQVRITAPASKVMAVIKAGGYGHGLIRVAQALQATDAFAVASIDEALLLHEAGITQPIILLEGFFELSELPLIARHQFEVVIHHISQVEALEVTRLERPLRRVWLKIDTGMHRLGFAPDQVISVWKRLLACASITKPVGLMTHFANADLRTAPTTLEQLERFAATTSGLVGPRSAANSAGIVAWPQAHMDWVRPGIMLYGVSPFENETAQKLGLKPVMTLQSNVIAIQQCRKGDAVGYGGEWVCPEDMRIGVVAIGYGDGYPRAAGTGTPVLVNNQRVSLIGRVSMDMICVDLRTTTDVRVGDPVCLWGDGLPVEEIAHHAGTIGYELLCRITSRVRMNVS